MPERCPTCHRENKHTNLHVTPALVCFNCDRIADAPEAALPNDVHADLKCSECFGPMALVGVMVIEGEASLLDLHHYSQARRLASGSVWR